VEDCDAALLIDPGNATALLRRAASNEQRERYLFAYRDYQEVLYKHPSNASARTGSSRVSKAMSDSEGPGWRKKYAKELQAQSYATSSDTTVTHKSPMLPTIAASSPSCSTTTTMTSTECEKQYNKIKDEGNRLVAAASAKLKAGDSASAATNFRAAITKYTSCMDLDSSKVAAPLNRALCRLRLEDFAAALQDTDIVLAIDPNNAKAAFRRAQALTGLGRFEDAKDMYANSLRRDPLNATLKKGLAEVQRKIVDAQPVTGEDKLAQLAAERARIQEECAQLKRDMATTEAKVASVKTQVEEKKVQVKQSEAKLASASNDIDAAVTEVKSDIKFMEMAAAAEAAEKTDAERAKKATADRAQTMSATPTTTTVDATDEKNSPAATIPSTQQVTSGSKKKRSPTKRLSPEKMSGGTPKGLKPVEFMRCMRRVMATPQKLADMLAETPPHLLPKLFSNQLDADHIEAVLSAMEFMEPEQAFNILQALTSVERFSMVVAFLAPEDVTRGETAFSRMRACIAYGTAPPTMTAEAIDSLVKAYTP